MTMIINSHDNNDIIINNNNDNTTARFRNPAAGADGRKSARSFRGPPQTVDPICISLSLSLYIYINNNNNSNNKYHK